MKSTIARDGHEVEWQFDTLDVRQVEQWLAARPADASPATGAERIEELTDTYLDTEDWRLHNAGFSLRIRSRAGRPPEATLKALVAARDGARVRREISEALKGSEDSSDGQLPEGTRLLVAPGPVGQRLRALVGARPLRVLFVWKTQRRIVPLLAAGRPVGEIALDEGEVARAEAGEPARVHRVEVELSSDATPADLEPFVAALRKGCG